jgi:hypothetical protein
LWHGEKGGGRKVGGRERGRKGDFYFLPYEEEIEEGNEMKLSIPQDLRDPRERNPGETLASFIFFFQGFSLFFGVPPGRFRTFGFVDPAVGNPTAWYGKPWNPFQIGLGFCGFTGIWSVDSL